MKKCSTCHQEKDVTEFRRDKNTNDGLQYRCKSCASTKIKSAYTEKYYKKYRPVQRRRIDENLRKINEYKQGGCLLCYENQLICLDLHHVKPEHKDFHIANMASLKWERIEQELKKCVVLCRNCHAKVHANILTLS